MGTPGKQNSVVTIFSIWNSMIGTSTLTMPWAIKQAGFVNGILLVIVMAAIMTYTSYRVVMFCNSFTTDKEEDAGMTEFSDVVRIVLGKTAGAVALICSVLTFLVASIVYWILMTNYVYNIVVFIYIRIHDILDTNQTVTSGTYHDVVCKNETDAITILPEYFKKVWHEKYTVPLFLILLLFPLLNFKSPTFFTKFNALATVSVVYFLVFVSVKAGKWGFHIDKDLLDPTKPEFINNFRDTFPATTGVATLAFFIQNALVAILRNQKHPENNIRDLILAFTAVCITYVFVGAIFYATFPLGEDCLADNLLNNLPPRDIMSFVARMFLFFQMMCVLPLLVYVMRIQSLSFFFHTMWPSVAHVLFFNACIVTICVLFAVFEPNVGRIVSFAGAFSGLTYAIVLPCLTYVVSSHKQGTLTKLKIVVHCTLIGISFLNFIGQFVTIGHTS